MTLLLIFFGLSVFAAAGVVVASMSLFAPRAGLALEAPLEAPLLDESERSLLRRFVRPFEILTHELTSRSERRNRQTLAESLLAADIRLRASEFMLIRIGLTALLAVLALLRFGLGPQFVVAGVIGYFAPRFYVRYRRGRRLHMFNLQLPDTLTLLANALKAGYSFPQAIESVSRNAAPPISQEFARVVREMSVGRSPEQALAGTLARVPSDDLELILTAVSIHTQVGGNLSRVLDSISHTIRERIRVKDQIHTLTAQARMSGWIITLLPIGLALVLYLISPGYFRGMLSDPLGWILLILAAFAIVVGNAIIRRIVNIKV